MTKRRTEKEAALVYCRVSTRSLAEGTSLDSQSELCAAHARRLGYAVARVTREVHTGAELFERKGLSRDRADIRAGRYKALIAYSVDRLTRDEAHLAILKAECDRAGCRLIFVTGGADGNLYGEAYAARVERHNFAERTGRGRRSKLRQGCPTFNGWAPYGYRPDREAGVFRVHEPEAEVVRRIFSLCAGGRGMHSIASAFNREGLPSPKSEHCPGSKWSSGTVSMILNNRSYAGGEACRESEELIGGGGHTRMDSGRARLAKGVHPAIVSPELWEECRRKIRDRAAGMKNAREYPTLLRGHIFCAACGAGMVRNYFRRGKYEYLKYRCGSRWRPFLTDCRGEAVPLEPVHAWAWGIVKSVLRDPAAASLTTREHTSHDSADLAAARRAHETAAVALEALRAAGGGEALRPYVEQATRVEQRLRDIVAALEEAEGRSAGLTFDLILLCERAGRGGDGLTLDEQRAVLTALGFKVFANGGDPMNWRYEISA